MLKQRLIAGWCTGRNQMNFLSLKLIHSLPEPGTYITAELCPSSCEAAESWYLQGPSKGQDKWLTERAEKCYFIPAPWGLGPHRVVLIMAGTRKYASIQVICAAKIAVCHVEPITQTLEWPRFCSWVMFRRSRVTGCSVRKRTSWDMTVF